MKARLVIQASFFTLLMPGTVTILIPYLIVGGSPMARVSADPVRWVPAIVLGIAGLTGLLYCIWGFAFYGRGTLAPVRPPELLVIQGLYRYTRNPMYMSILGILLAESILLRSQELLIYAAIVFVLFAGFIRIYEEPHLRRQYGDTYAEYCRSVPRWGITFRSFNNTEGKNS